MKWLLNIVAIVLVLIGGLWILQGTNIIASGFMAGRLEYALLGIVVAVVGIGLLWFINLRQKKTPTSGTKSSQ
jgi:lysozyme family protein